MADKIRVLQLIASSHGGGASHVLDLSLGLDEAQFYVTAAMPKDGGNVSAQQFTDAGIKFVPLPIRSGLAWREVRKIRQVVKDGRFHIIHVHGMRAALYGRLAVLGMTQRPRVLFSIHGFAAPFYKQPKRLFYLTLERLLQHITDSTICVAQAEADLFLKHKLAPAKKVTVVHPGIDVQRFLQVDRSENGRFRQQLNLPADSQILLTACRLHIPRDFDTLLNAFAKTLTRFPKLHLLIAGDGPQREQILDKISQLELADHVHLLGFRQDIPQLLALADVVVLTSLGWEGYPLSTLEAQATGVPVIVTDAGGSREAVLHEKTGLVVPKQNAAAMAQALISLLENVDLRKHMGAAGRERAQTELSQEMMVEKMTAVYESQLKSITGRFGP